LLCNHSTEDDRSSVETCLVNLKNWSFSLKSVESELQVQQAQYVEAPRLPLQSHAQDTELEISLQENAADFFPEVHVTNEWKTEELATIWKDVENKTDSRRGRQLLQSRNN